MKTKLFFFCTLLLVAASASAVTRTVTNSKDAGAGSLRATIVAASSGDVIIFADSLAGKTITLASNLSTAIGKNISIQGNGLTISGNNAYRFLTINATDTVSISRLHFTKGMAGNWGVIENRGKLSLHSCIFSHNHNVYSSAAGGVLFNMATLSVSGCTMYQNSAAGSGGVLYNYSSGVATLTGNLFYGNTAGGNGNIVYAISNGTVISGGYNVCDTTSYNCSFTATGDKRYKAQPCSDASFKLLPGSAALDQIPTTALNSGYPTVDFYGNTMSAGSLRHAGAVQSQAAAGYTLSYTAYGRGAVAVAAGSPTTPDADGICPASSSVTLAASPSAEASFVGWWINGVKSSEASTTLVLSMTEHKSVRAVFSVTHTVANSKDAGTGSLRQAISDAISGEVIVFADSLAGKTIMLASTLTIDKDLDIQGNGVTLSGNSACQIMKINAGRTAGISRLHLTKGQSNSSGIAISNQGTLSLQACIFSHNKITANASSDGGAIYNSGTLKLSGCTLYKNSAAGAKDGYGRGGALMNTGTATLSGNLFYGNTANSGNSVNRYTGTITSGGYNVYDGGTKDFSFGAKDISSTVASCRDTSFKLLQGTAAVARIADSVLNNNYLTVDFYGTPMPANTQRNAGAVQAVVSNDTTLKSLSVTPGTLSPAFSAAVKSYTVSVDNSVSSVAIAAVANNDNATVSGAGTKPLGIGTNSFTLTVTAEDSSTASYTVVVTRAAGTTAVEVNTLAAVVTAYPNPASSYVNVSIAAEVGKVRAEVYTLDGSLCKRQEVYGASFTVDLSGCPNGVLLLRLITEQGCTAMRIVKN